MEQVESLLSVITFILKSLNHGQVDDMDVELLKSFSLSHLAIVENLRSSARNVIGVSPDSELKKRSNDSLEPCSYSLEIKQENQVSETPSDNDQINICEYPIEIDFSQHEFDISNREIDKEGPKVFEEPFCENTEKEDLESPKEVRKRGRDKEIKANDIVYRCLFCDLDFEEEEDFHNHDSEKHLQDGQFHCVCNEAFRDKRDAVNHFMSDHNKKNIYPCRECAESFFGNQELKEHLKNVHYKIVGYRQCPICLDGVTFDQSKSLQKHMYQVHKTVKFKCEICEKILTTKKSLESHKIQLHSDERLKYTCESCPQHYYNKNAYENHVAEHKGDPSYSCDKCSKKFYTAFYLQKHGYEHKNKDKRIYCTQCEYNTNKHHYTALMRHMATVHSDERPFKCNSCDTSFKTKLTLKFHERTHTGERPFKCKYCEKAFRTSYHRKTHEDIHEQNYKYSCKICDRKFIQGGNLQLHMRKHHVIDRTV